MPVLRTAKSEWTAFPRHAQSRRPPIAGCGEPLNSGKSDAISFTIFTIVTVGNQSSLETQKLFETKDFTPSQYLCGLSTETAALGEFVHKQTRQLLGVVGGDSAQVTDLLYQKYCGSQYFFGYPARPNLEGQAKIFKPLEPG